MTLFRRLVYLGYYFRQMNWTQLRRFKRCWIKSRRAGPKWSLSAWMTLSGRWN